MPNQDRYVELVFDMKHHVGDWSGLQAVNEKGNVRNQVKHIAQQCAWNTCQNDGFLIVQRVDGIVTIIAGKNPSEVADA